MNTAAAGLALLLLSPLAAWPGLGYDEASRPVALAGATLWMLGGMLRSRRGEPRLRVPRAASIASTAAVLLLAASAVVATDRYDAALGLATPLVALILFRGVGEGWLPREVLLSRGLAALGVVAVLFSGFGLYQSWFGDATGLGHERLAVSTLGNTNYSGIFAAVLAVTCAGAALRPGPKGVRILCALAAVLSGVLVGASQSRAGYLGLAAGAVVLAVAEGRERRWVVAAIALVLAGLPFAGGAGVAARVASIGGERDRSESVRLALWRDSVPLIRDHALLGVGVGNFRAAFPPYRAPATRDGTEAEDPHSTPLLLAAEGGPALALLVAALLVGLLVSAWKSRAMVPAAALVAMAVSGCFNSLSNHLPFGVLAGFLGGLCLEPREETDPARPAWAGWVAVLALAAWTSWSVRVLGADLDFAAGMSTSKPVLRERSMSLAVEAVPEHWRARLELANALRARGHGLTAAHHARVVLESRPHHAGAWAVLAETTPDATEAALAARRVRELTAP